MCTCDRKRRLADAEFLYKTALYTSFTSTPFPTFSYDWNALPLEVRHKSFSLLRSHPSCSTKPWPWHYSDIGLCPLLDTCRRTEPKSLFYALPSVDILRLRIPHVLGQRVPDSRACNNKCPTLSIGTDPVTWNRDFISVPPEHHDLEIIVVDLSDSDSILPFRLVVVYRPVSYTHLTLPTNREV